MEIISVIAIIVIVSVLATFILDQIFKKKRYVKYIPVIVMFPFMLYNFITMYSVPTENFQALGRFVMGLLLLSASVPALICSIVLDIVHKVKTEKN